MQIARTMKKRTIKQQSSITTVRNTSLNDAASRDAGFSCQGLVGEFIGYYLRCELFASRLQNFYCTDKNYKKTGLNTKTLTNACEHFRTFFPNDIILVLFQGGGGKRDSMSARQLRNGYLHELSESNRAEILDNGKYLIKMKRFLELRI